ncbi:MAG: hypothetical protein OXG62_13685 [Nitrospinae bacterium]|nr:hypothetical protein [Nitrospinota bacterium]
MTELLDAVRAKVSPDCLTQRCRRPGCGISLKGAPQQRVIIDFDKPDSPLGERDTRCDFLFVADDSNGPGWVAPLELKGGRVDVSEAIEQLQAGARVAEALVSQDLKVNFRPVLASGNIPKAERTALKRTISFHGNSTPVRRIRCGAPLTQGLRQ